MALPTVESIQTGISDLLKRIQTEGITGTQGEVLLAPQKLQTSPTGQAMPTLAADTLGQAQTPIQLPTPTSTLGTQAGAMVAGATADQTAIQKYIDLMTPKETPESKQYKDLMAQIQSELPSTTGRGAAQLAAEQVGGVPEKTQALTDVQNQINAKIAEFNKVEADYMKATQATEEVPGVSKGIVGGQQAQLAKSLAVQRVAQAAEVGMLQAQASALQGNLDRAQNIANRSVDLKYSDATDLINTQLKQLELIQGQLTKTEKIRADAITAYLNDQKTAISTAVANEKDKNATLLNQMQKYPDAGIQLTDTLEQANQKVVQNSAIYRKEATPTGGGTNVVITPDDKRNLLGAGFTSDEIPQIVSDMNQYGIDAVLEGVTDSNQKKALQKVYGVATDTEQFLSKDYFKGLFTEDQMKAAAKDAGFRGFWTGWESEKEKYLEYLMKTVESYRQAGFTDKEILNKMQ